MNIEQYVIIHRNSSDLMDQYFFTDNLEAMRKYFKLVLLYSMGIEECKNSSECVEKILINNSELYLSSNFEHGIIDYDLSIEEHYAKFLCSKELPEYEKFEKYNDIIENMFPFQDPEESCDFVIEEERDEFKTFMLKKNKLIHEQMVSYFSKILDSFIKNDYFKICIDCNTMDSLSIIKIKPNIKKGYMKLTQFQ
jgi:hypothetical protein